MLSQCYMALLDRFHVLCTLSSEYFSTFPHGTCLLLVSRSYLALDGAYHLLCAAFPNNTTLICHMTKNVNLQQVYNLLWNHNQMELVNLHFLSNDKLTLQFATVKTAEIQRWAFSCSLAVTKEILVSFFSSTY